MAVWCLCFWNAREIDHQNQLGKHSGKKHTKPTKNPLWPRIKLIYYFSPCFLFVSYYSLIHPEKGRGEIFLFSLFSGWFLVQSIHKFWRMHENALQDPYIIFLQKLNAMEEKSDIHWDSLLSSFRKKGAKRNFLLMWMRQNPHKWYITKPCFLHYLVAHIMLHLNCFYCNHWLA